MAQLVEDQLRAAQFRLAHWKAQGSKATPPNRSGECNSQIQIWEKEVTRLKEQVRTALTVAQDELTGLQQKANPDAAARKRISTLQTRIAQLTAALSR